MRKRRTVYELECEIKDLREDLATQYKQVELWDVVAKNKDAEIERIITQVRITQSAWEKEMNEKDAEIERLLTKHEKEKNLLLTVLDKQTTEIERLNEGWTKEAELAARCHRDYETHLREKDAEIERLKAENARLKKWNLMTDEQVVMDLKSEIERLKDILDNEHTEMRIKNVLITELADWLQDQIEHMGPEYKDAEKLIQRAREVGKE